MLKADCPSAFFRQRMNCAITLKDADARDVMAELIKLNDFVIYLEKNTDNLCRSWIVEVIADIHHGITVIHPFTDGNGRTSRGHDKNAYAL